MDARSFGGRRTGFMTENEREERLILEERLLELARRAIRRYTP